MENKVLKDINPRSCGMAQCLPNHSWGPNARQYYLLHYVISGEGIFTTDRDSLRVPAGQIFVIRPHEIVTYTANELNPWQYCWVGFESSLDLSDILSQPTITAPECAHIFYALRDCADIAIDREWYICGKIYELLSLLKNQRKSNKNRSLRYVRMSQNYIETHFQNPTLRVDKLAKDLNLDRAYFSKIFREHTGKSPQRYIVDFRLDKAAEILAHQGLSPGEVAEQVGYNSIYNFSRMFSRKFGVPPGAYSAKARHKKALP